MRPSMPSMIEMKVSRVGVNPMTELPVLVLESAEGEQLAIGIGAAEARAIATELSKVGMQRPMTHDLMFELVRECGARVDRIELREAEAGAFHATIFLLRETADGAAAEAEHAQAAPIAVDARASDAVALALRSGAPIRVEREAMLAAREDLRRPAAHLLPYLRSEALDGLPTAAARGAPSPVTLACGGGDASRFPSLEALHDEAFGKWKM